VVEQTDSSTWHTDINEAFGCQNKEKKSLCFSFTEVIGVDGYVKLQNEVLKTPGFKKWPQTMLC
jgi:hypothetical protein